MAWTKISLIESEVDNFQFYFNDKTRERRIYNTTKNYVVKLTPNGGWSFKLWSNTVDTSRWNTKRVYLCTECQADWLYLLDKVLDHVVYKFKLHILKD